jgi:hypothetical protein
MSKARYAGLIPMIALLCGCEVGSAKDRSEQVEKPAEPQTVERAGVQPGEVPAPRIDSPEAARRLAARSGINQNFTEVTRPNAEGEPIRTYVPQADPVIEVPEGSACGTKDPDGRYLSCAPGTFCMKTSEADVTGLCRAAPRAPRLDG